MAKKGLEEIWDRLAKKLFVYVGEAKELAPSKAKDGALDSYVKLNYGKFAEQRTQVQKKSLNPKFDELFFYDSVPSDHLVLSVYQKNFGSDDFLGEVRLDRLDQLPPDETVDQWYDLNQRSAQKKKKTDRVSGRIQIRLYYTDEKETKPNPPPENNLFINQHLYAFKTGDLIAYNETSLLAGVLKICSPAKFSRVGMILELPNRWTERYELFVVEVTRNVDGLLDVYNDSKNEGVKIFRLKERIHQIHAQSISWVPLRQPLDQQSGQKMVEWIWNVHGNLAKFTEASLPLGGTHATASDPLALRFVHREFRTSPKISLLDLYACEFVFRALKLSGRVPEITPYTPMNPQAIVTLDCFAPPVLLRERRVKKPFVIPNGKPAESAGSVIQSLQRSSGGGSTDNVIVVSPAPSNASNATTASAPSSTAGTPILGTSPINGSPAVQHAPPPGMPPGGYYIMVPPGTPGSHFVPPGGFPTPFGAPTSQPGSLGEAELRQYLQSNPMPPPPQQYMYGPPPAYYGMYAPPTGGSHLAPEQQHHQRSPSAGSQYAAALVSPRPPLSQQQSAGQLPVGGSAVSSRPPSQTTASQPLGPPPPYSAYKNQNPYI